MAESKTETTTKGEGQEGEVAGTQKKDARSKLRSSSKFIR